MRGTPIPRADMVHARGMMYPGADIGVGPITYGARLISAASLEAEYVARRFSDNGMGAAVPDSVIEADGPVTSDQTKKIGQQISARSGGLNRGPLVLDGGLKFKQIQFSAREMELIASAASTRMSSCAR